ncbi:alpha/beta fold hydrolase [Amycolatopsis sp. CA-161197]|uniref:alpha/beta fold hydrolase n=1 Tax=unclassified Amycolatopsis TaxID=2618356 RepID=UPI0034539B76
MESRLENLDAAGQRIAYRTSPGSGPAVVFVHGNSSSSAAWAHVLDGPFGRRFRVLALDLPGHGESARAKDPATYSIPGYARVVADFAAAAGAGDAVLVGWSLGGHIALSASTRLPGVRGIVVHGTPPVSSPADLATAFLPNPAVATGFTGEVSREDAAEYARAQLALGSPLPLDAAVAHILATDPEARAGLGRSLQSAENADERAIVAGARVPVAILHGALEQLVNLEYLRTVTSPRLWRGEVQVLPGAGHTPQDETPDAYEAVLTAFLDDLA